MSLHFVQYRPMSLNIERYIALTAGFESTHPRSEQWLANYCDRLKASFGQDVFSLIEAVGDYVGVVEDFYDMSAQARAIDVLAQAQGSRPAHWLPSGDSRAMYACPSLASAVAAWRASELVWASYDDDFDANEVTNRAADLSSLLQQQGGVNDSWCFRVEFPEAYDTEVPHEGFVQADPARPYYSAGKYTQVLCKQGRVTFWQGTAYDAPSEPV